jgi:acetoacetyl-CoA synthetase
VTDRWQQIEPTVLVAVDGYRYGDKPVDRRAEVAAIRQALPSLVHTVSLSYLDTQSAPPDGALAWSDLAAETDEPMEFESVEFDHPLYVLYSSGPPGCRSRSCTGTAGS